MSGNAWTIAADEIRVGDTVIYDDCLRAVWAVERHDDREGVVGLRFSDDNPVRAQATAWLVLDEAVTLVVARRPWRGQEADGTRLY